MRLAYFSPLTPQRSGIADYSEELLPYLAEDAEITLFVDRFQPANRELTSRFTVLDYRRNPSHLNRLHEFDVILYHMGNDHRYHAGMIEAMKVRPGVVVFHDFALQDFFLGLARDRNDLRLYLDEVEFCYGANARQQAGESLKRGATPWIVNQPLDYPLNCRIAKSAEGIIVHSAWQAERFAQLAPDVPLAQIKHHITARAAATPPRTTVKTGAVNIASFGLITPDKGIERALRALAKLRNDYHFRYTLVGSPANFPDLAQIVQRSEMEDRVTVTGHVGLDEFQQHIHETDIAICLRERSVGATSGSLCRIMAAGVAAIVSDVGAFSEFPDDAVVKVDHNECADALLEAYLRKLIEDRGLRDQIGANARAYVLAEHRIEDSARKYLGFLRQVIAARPRRAFVQSVAAEISELGVKHSDDALLQSVAAEIVELAPAMSFTVAAEPANTAVLNRTKATSGNGDGRLRKLEGVDYKRAAIEYVAKLDPERRHYLFTKPFYNLANKPPKHAGEGMDAETFRHFCDFANIAVALALPPGSRILDVGCGSGWLSEYFARLGYVVHGIDISPDLIAMARERIERVGYDVDHETELRCTFAVHDIESAPLADQFDGVVCYDSLHHFEDERAVVRHLAAVTRYAGSLFILEGDRPAEGSATEAELLEVMHRFETLESPFSREYLRALLDENGFAVVGDYLSVNGLYPRSQVDGDRIRVQTPDVNYLLCKKVIAEAGRPASSVATSLQPRELRARFQLRGTIPASVKPGDPLSLPLEIENTGDTLWLTETVSAGIVMPAVRVFDHEQNLVTEFHGEPMLPHTVAPAESVQIKIECRAPQRTGSYTLKIDLVDQQVCWFEERGSLPLLIEFTVEN
jgi:2-polyprenyl-3-methyl-5-hydroxy-6-metoxy-1,4-benzoquinol methylase/glycosyltransferase involved in cell wall biosynthesis